MQDDGLSPKKTSFTFELTNDQQELLLGLMVSGNYRKREVPYSLYSIEGDHFNATLYQKEKHGKRKLCVQGSKAEDFVLFQLEPVVLGAATLGYEKELSPELFSAHAGSDESGKGDYFGPLVVCTAYTDEALSEEMIKLGVKDCKQMSDKSVLTVGAKLRQLLGPSRYSVVKLGNAAYNRLYAKMRNINRMLAWAHGTAIEELLTKMPGCSRVVVDQFAPTEATILRALKPLGKLALYPKSRRAKDFKRKGVHLGVRKDRDEGYSLQKRKNEKVKPRAHGDDRVTKKRSQFGHALSLQIYSAAYSSAPSRRRFISFRIH